MTFALARRTIRSSFTLAAAAVALAALAGCASTQLTDRWRDPTYTGPPSKNFLVISMAKDPARRRMWEDAFVSGLRDKGVSAATSYSLFPGDLPDTESVKQKVREVGFDAVVVTHRLDSQNVERFVPPTVTNVPVTRVSPWGYYNTYYTQIYQPGYVETDHVVRFQTDMWISDGKGGRLVWIGRSESVNPTSPGAVSKQLTGRIIPDLVKKGLI